MTQYVSSVGKTAVILRTQPDHTDTKVPAEEATGFQVKGAPPADYRACTLAPTTAEATVRGAQQAADRTHGKPKVMQLLPALSPPTTLPRQTPGKSRTAFLPTTLNSQFYDELVLF